MSVKNNEYNNDYRASRKRRSLEDVKRKRARRKWRIYRRLALLVAMLGAAVIAIVLLLSVLTGGDESTTEPKTDSIAANATVNNTLNSGAENTTEDATMEEIPTEEPTTQPPLRYGDDLYNDGEFVVCIDAGHGGNDTGCVGIDGSYEKDDVLMLAMLIVKELEGRGVKVVTTRTVDEWVDLADRPIFANRQNADVFVSVHRNSLENDTVTKGFEAWIHSDNSENAEELANMIMGKLEDAGISKNRGVKKGTQGNSEENYKVNSGSAMPSVLLEMGFMSSPKDNQLYKDNAKEYAKAIADAVIQWSLDKQY